MPERCDIELPHDAVQRVDDRLEPAVQLLEGRLGAARIRHVEDEAVQERRAAELAREDGCIRHDAAYSPVLSKEAVFAAHGSLPRAKQARCDRLAVLRMNLLHPEPGGVQPLFHRKAEGRLNLRTYEHHRLHAVQARRERDRRDAFDERAVAGLGLLHRDRGQLPLGHVRECADIARGRTRALRMNLDLHPPDLRRGPSQQRDRAHRLARRHCLLPLPRDRHRILGTQGDDPLQAHAFGFPSRGDRCP